MLVRFNKSGREFSINYINLPDGQFYITPTKGCFKDFNLKSKNCMKNNASNHESKMLKSKQ